MMQMPERIFHLADIEPKKFDAITYFEKHPGKDLLYDIPTKLKTKEMILQVLIKEPSNLDYEPFFVDPILKPKLTPRRLLEYAYLGLVRLSISQRMDLYLGPYA